MTDFSSFIKNFPAIKKCLYMVKIDIDLFYEEDQTFHYNIYD